MFLATHAANADNGVLAMTNLCRTAGVRAPESRQCGSQFIHTLWRPKMTAAPQTDRTGQTTHSDDGRHGVHDGVHEAHDGVHEAHDEAHDQVSWSEHLIMAAWLVTQPADKDQP